MSRTFDYLVCFSVYSLIILIIGKSSFGESDSIGKFFIGERKCGTWRLFCTFVGTWVSAATIMGYTGNVYENGTSVIAVTVIPWFIGAGLLYVISGRIYGCDMLTIPQFIGDRYQSRFLRTCCALLLSCGYVFYLVIQIKGFGIAAATLLNIDYKVAIFLVYLFILYSTFGGFNSVTKTDGGNLIMLTISIVIVYFVVVGGIEEGNGLLTNAQVFGHSAGISKNESLGKLMNDYSPLMYLTMFFGWGMGLATNPQYLIRIVAARNLETARKVLVYSLVFLAVFYFCLTQIGLGLRFTFPDLSSSFDADNIFVYAIGSLIQSRFSGFFLISVIGACVSTANSQLLLIGSMMSYDVVAQYGKWKKTEDRILGLAQLFIFLGGTLALLLSLNPPTNSLFFGADIWGFFSVILTPLVYGTLYYKRATKTGAWAAFVTGVAGTILLCQQKLPVYWGFPVTLGSTMVFFLVPIVEEMWKNRSHAADAKKEKRNPCYADEKPENEKNRSRVESEVENRQ